jgi:hypothetical protein
LDADGSGEVTAEEFTTLGFLFNFKPKAIRKIYEEFDVLIANLANDAGRV